MPKSGLAAAVLGFVLTVVPFADAQQLYRLPDVKTMKRLTTQYSDHASDIPGKETVMDFYSASNGQVITVYSFNGRNVVFSTHSNSDIQNTYRLFMDVEGKGLFQEINRGAPWQIPRWAR